VVVVVEFDVVDVVVVDGGVWLAHELVPDVVDEIVGWVDVDVVVDVEVGCVVVVVDVD
jgi:hypothetical protein